MAKGRIRRELKKVRRSQPGARFEQTHERLRIGNRTLRVFVIVLGIVLMFVAGATFWLPGPNFVLALVGLALISGQWRRVARLLDRGEVALRRWKRGVWDPMPRWKQRFAIGCAWLVFFAAIAAIAYGAWRNHLLPSWIPYLG
jgi:hypothetical protein